MAAIGTASVEVDARLDAIATNLSYAQLGLLPVDAIDAAIVMISMVQRWRQVERDETAP